MTSTRVKRIPLRVSGKAGQGSDMSPIALHAHEYFGMVKKMSPQAGENAPRFLSNIGASCYRRFIPARDRSAKQTRVQGLRGGDGKLYAVEEDPALTSNASMRGVFPACAYRFNSPEVVS